MAILLNLVKKSCLMRFQSYLAYRDVRFIKRGGKYEECFFHNTKLLMYTLDFEPYPQTAYIYEIMI